MGHGDHLAVAIDDDPETVGIGLESAAWLKDSSSGFATQLEDQWATAAGKEPGRVRRSSFA